MTEISKYFCTAPWTHTYVSPQGERRLCCASREDATFQKQYIDAGTNDNKEFSPITLKEHWNSEYMKDIRKRMLAGEKISQCQVCNDQILNLYTYKSYFTETLFPHKIADILENTDETGHTTLEPVSYDYRISNLCNFKCRMCGDQLSSSWESENKKYQKINFSNDKWLYPPVRSKIAAFQKEVLEVELQEAVDKGIVEEIYWVGGEPLMWDLHWSIMDQLVRTNKSRDVVVRYNTNLSRILYKNYNLFDMLSNFKKVNICASIDGIGNIGEYIRTGLIWNQWLDNFKQGLFLIDIYGNDAIVFDVTLTTPGLFGLKDLFDIVTELDVKSYLKITFAFDPSIVMNPLCLPRHILEKEVNSLLEYFRSRVTLKNKIYIETLEDLLKRKTFEEQWPNTYKEGIKKGKENILNLEKIRNSPITFEEILSDDAKSWWNNI